MSWTKQVEEMKPQAAVAIILVCCIACVMLVQKACAPPLRLAVHGNVVVVDVQTLGEYLTTIRRIRLTDRQSKQVIWEIVSRGTPQFNTLELRVGANPTTIEVPREEIYNVVTPAGKATFNLEAERDYLVEVWGESNGLRNSGTFRLH